MRKRIMLAAAAASLVMLTGCLAETYPLTEEEQDIIAEYAATVLLRNDKNYTQALVSPMPTITPQPTPSLSAEPTPGPDGQGNTPTENGNSTAVTESVSLSEVYGLEGLSVAYDGYELLDIIEENGGYVVRAGEGKKLLRMEFTLTNTAGIEQVFEFSGQNISYQLDCGEKSYVQPKITGIEGDMLFMKTTLAAGGSCKGCVIFEISDKAKPEEGRVIVSRGDAFTSIITLE